MMMRRNRASENVSNKPLSQHQSKSSSLCIKKFEEFCKRTDLHGYKYIVMPNLTLFERSCWGLAVLVSIVLAVYFVVTAYRWYARNPIVTVIESTHGAIWDVPFPAVTVCDINLISRKAAMQFSTSVALPENVTSDEVFEILRLAPLLHASFNTTSEHKKKLLVLQSVLDLNNIEIERFFEMLSPASNCKNLVKKCVWKSKVYHCQLLFQLINTQHGFCCTFNYFALDNADRLNNLSELYQPEGPRRVASCGYQTALTVYLHVNTSEYYSSMIATYGIMVLVDNAYNFPDEDSTMRVLGPSSEMFLALSPERTYSNGGIKSFKPDQRQCYFPDEVELGRLRHYSYHNCLVNKKMRHYELHCNCIPDHFPGKASIRRCNFHDMDCLQTTREMMYDSDYILKEEFNCLPDCEHFDYPLEVAIGILSNDAINDGSSTGSNAMLKNTSILNVFFNDLVSTRYRRDVYLNWQNLLASFGGLLSLMLGFTVISAVDFVIFFTFRMAYDLFSSVLSTDSNPQQIPADTLWAPNKVHNQDPKKDNWITNKHNNWTNYNTQKY